MMTHVKTLASLVASLLMTLAAGCAPAYHSYSGCQVDCKYCAPPPLPYTRYDGCVCHSCAASKYLSVEPSPIDEAPAETRGSESTD